MQYEPLRKEDGEIRLLRIIDDGSEPITCTMEHVSLGASPSYKALSYCWGDASDAVPVLVNGREMKVTVNLESALRQFRGEDQGWIWVDAVCINQGDLGERGEQVFRMGEIYSKATKVIAWLGSERDNSDRAMEFTKSCNKISSEYEARGDGFSWSNPISREDCRADDERSWTALAALFKRPYWSRLWIVQEIAVAKEVGFRCGLLEISYHDLNSALWIAWRRKYFPRFPDVNPLVGTHFRKIFDLLICSQPGNRGHDSNNILNLLHYTQYHDATDLRDHIYGLVALAPGGAELFGHPRYDEPVEDLYIRLTNGLISTLKCLDIICFKPPNNSGLKLPTWVLDISQACLREHPDAKYLTDMPLTWPSREEGLESPVFLDLPGCEGSSILKIEGLRLDIVNGFGLDEEQLGGDILVHSDGTTNGYLSEDDMRSAIIRTLSWDWKVGLFKDTETLCSLGWKRLLQLQTQVSSPTSHVKEWLDQNRNLKIAGQTLEDRMLGGPDHVGLEVWRARFPDLRDEDVENGVAERLLTNWIAQELEDFRRWSRKILVTENGFVADGHAQAKRGDLICLLKNCWKLAILRPTGDGFFRIIGDAVLPGFGKGTERLLDLQRRVDEGRTETFQII